MSIPADAGRSKQPETDLSRLRAAVRVTPAHRDAVDEVLEYARQQEMVAEAAAVEAARINTAPSASRSRRAGCG